ncbi:exodeoxyribonuclease VII small subunit [Commensalibacter sp. M0402]|nr:MULTISPECIES: exodeoxyribonuclease VII small subunit [Commensalibacter]MBI0082399.1 exodeoxyribonuclease VII small subunit [Commensalibacter sp. W6292M3]MBI0087709.1 exodeoxyribonuclease VII small subunit [Commensalibacter melissae]
MTDDLSSLSFEDALNELEKIVHNLETGQQKLEEAIVSYERGALLRRYCEKKLNEAEARVKMIVEKDNQSLDTETIEKI